MATIQFQATPNPNAMKITASENLFTGNGSVNAKKGDTPDHPLLAELLKLDGVDNLFGFQDFVTVNKMPDADWEDLKPKIEEVFNKM